ERDYLFLVRDRLGIKPLYYWEGGGALLFASEIKALLVSDDVARAPNPSAISDFLTWRYVPGPQTMFQGIFKLPAGHWLRHSKSECRVERYWTPEVSPDRSRTDREYEERFSELWRETIRLHLESDVPVGVYLSGGLDSSLVAAEMTALANAPVHTFSAGSEWEGDEAPAARAVATDLGVTHHALLVNTAD